MAQKFLMTMVLSKQGRVRGGSTRKDGPLDFSQGVECYGFEMGATVPVASSSGQATGKSRHQPIIIRKMFDSASPIFWRALSTSEIFESATLTFNRIGPDGKPVVDHTIELTNGTICAVRTEAGADGKPSEKVSLTYESLLMDKTPIATLPPGFKFGTVFTTK